MPVYDLREDEDVQTHIVAWLKHTKGMDVQNKESMRAGEATVLYTDPLCKCVTTYNQSVQWGFEYLYD